MSANAKNQLHKKEEIWILANYHLRISSKQSGIDTHLENKGRKSLLFCGCRRTTSGILFLFALSAAFITISQSQSSHPSSVPSLTIRQIDQYRVFGVQKSRIMCRRVPRLHGVLLLELVLSVTIRKSQYHIEGV